MGTFYERARLAVQISLPAHRLGCLINRNRGFFDRINISPRIFRPRTRTGFPCAGELTAAAAMIPQWHATQATSVVVRVGFPCHSAAIIDGKSAAFFFPKFYWASDPTTKGQQKKQHDILNESILPLLAFCWVLLFVVPSFVYFLLWLQRNWFRFLIRLPKNSWMFQYE